MTVRAWLRVSNISGESRGVFETRDVELQSERLEPLYDQAAMDDAILAERAACVNIAINTVSNLRPDSSREHIASHTTAHNIAEAIRERK